MHRKKNTQSFHSNSQSKSNNLIITKELNEEMKKPNRIKRHVEMSGINYRLLVIYYTE